MGGEGGSHAGVRIHADMHEAARLREDIAALQDRLAEAKRELQTATARLAVVKRYLMAADLTDEMARDLDALLTGEHQA